MIEFGITKLEDRGACLHSSLHVKDVENWGSRNHKGILKIKYWPIVKFHNQDADVPLFSKN